MIVESSVKLDQFGNWVELWHNMKSGEIGTDHRSIELDQSS